MDNDKGIKQNKTLSKWQTLMKYPNSLFMIEQSLRSRNIRAQKVELDRYIEQAMIVNKLIILGERIRDDFNKQRISLIDKDTSQTEIGDIFDIDDLFTFEDFDDNDVDEFFQDNVDELLIGKVPDELNGDIKDSEKQKIKIDNFVDASSDLKNINIDKNEVKDWINLFKIQDDSYVEAEVFPKGFHCWQCGHFLLLNSTYHGDLKCTCCNKGRMEQEALVFICPICANIFPIHPWWERDLTTVNNQPFNCPDHSCSGHIHLFLNTKDLMKSNWTCQKCRTRFINKSEIFGKYKERRLVLYCNKCGVYSKLKESSLRIPMKLKPTTARLFNPLRFEAITVNDKQLNKKNLEENLLELKNSGDSLYWNLEDLPDLSLLITNKFTIKNIFLVKNIKTFNAVFGYQSALPNNHRIEPIPNFFKYGNKYNIYFFEHIGNGLVIEFDKESIIKNFSKIGVQNNESYDQLIDCLIDRLENEKIQVILNDKDSNEIKLLKALHTFNHILLQNLFKKIGLESFRSKILLRDGLIILYEIEDISTGGLYQLTLEAGSRIELLEYFSDCDKNLRTCIHDCVDFCKQCSFVDDYYCRPFINNEVLRWIPSNAFLSRKISRKLLLIKD